MCGYARRILEDRLPGDIRGLRSSTNDVAFVFLETGTALFVGWEVGYLAAFTAVLGGFTA